MKLVNYYEKLVQNPREPYPSLEKKDVVVIESRLRLHDSLDSFCNYLLGLCVKTYDVTQSLQLFVKSVKELFTMISVTSSFAFFWGAWMELVSLVKTRSNLLFVLSKTHDTIFRQLFWLAVTNKRKGVCIQLNHDT